MTTVRTASEFKLKAKIAAALGVVLAIGLLAATPADARRGGSFGSRGSRTYSQPAPTATAPGFTAPVQRSMTAPGSAPGGATYQPGYRPGYAPGYSPGFGYSPFGRSPFGGFMGGLVAGGLIGGLFGHHWGGGWGGYGWGGGGGGLLTIILQLVILFVIVSLVMRIFRRRTGFAEPMFAGPSPGPSASFLGGAPSFGGPQPGYAGGFGGTAVPPTAGWEIAITPQDQQAFERLLMEVQDAYAHEDYARLRERCTPEVMGYLAEELSDNATHGRKNDVIGTRLLQADVGEAWREGDTDYATASMKFESIDIMRDRSTGAVLSGDPNHPTQATELWTFARHMGGDWKLSAIQS